MLLEESVYKLTGKLSAFQADYKGSSPFIRTYFDKYKKVFWRKLGFIYTIGHINTLWSLRLWNKVDLFIGKPIYRL